MERRAQARAPAHLGAPNNIFPAVRKTLGNLNDGNQIYRNHEIQQNYYKIALKLLHDSYKIATKLGITLTKSTAMKIPY
jgi:hypothetical protein